MIVRLLLIGFVRLAAFGLSVLFAFFPPPSGQLWKRDGGWGETR